MSGVVTPYSILLTGLLLIVAALHPFGSAPWLTPAAQRSTSLTAAVYVLGVLGTGYCVYGAITGQRADWWLWANVPALVYWLLMTGTTKTEDKNPTEEPDGGKEGGDA